MNLLNGILGVCLLLSLLTIVVLIRYAITWRMDIRKAHSRLNIIEKEGCCIRKECPVKQQLENMARHKPSLLDNKPDSIELIRQHIHFYHPSLIDDIIRHTGEKPSSTDELLCMMIKLEYTNKEIASILSITNSSVLTARYRLKRKLGLLQHQQLDAWIQSMGKKETASDKRHTEQVSDATIQNGIQ